MNKIYFTESRSELLSSLETREVTLSNGRKLNRLSTQQLAYKLRAIMRAENAHFFQAQKAKECIFGLAERPMLRVNHPSYRTERYEDAYAVNVLGR